jgi:uncharacterized protein YyaL (SSP411 family)
VLAIPASALALPPVLDKPVEKDVPVNAWVCQGVTCLAPIRELDVLRRTCAQGAFR